jgi:hypothetical protein
MKIKNFVEISRLGFVDASSASYTLTNITIRQSESINNMSGTTKTSTEEVQVAVTVKLIKPWLNVLSEGTKKLLAC